MCELIHILPPAQSNSGPFLVLVLLHPSLGELWSKPGDDNATTIKYIKRGLSINCVVGHIEMNKSVVWSIFVSCRGIL